MLFADDMISDIQFANGVQNIPRDPDSWLDVCPAEKAWPETTKTVSQWSATSQPVNTWLDANKPNNGTVPCSK